MAESGRLGIAAAIRKIESVEPISTQTDSGIDEREAAMGRILLFNPRTEVGSKKTVPVMVSFAARSE